MGQRQYTARPDVHLVLRGRTLGEIVESGTTLAVSCQACSRRSTWSPKQARNEVKFEPFMARDIGDLAGKLRCAACRSTDLFVTIVPKASIGP